MARPNTWDQGAVVDQPQIAEMAKRMQAQVAEAGKMRRGKVIFLAGDVGSGRSEVMAALAKSLMGARSILGRCSYGEYRAVKTVGRDRVPLAMAATDLAIKALRVTVPLVPAILDWAEIGNVGAGLLHESTARAPADGLTWPETVDLLKRLAQRAAEDGPTVWCIDHVDRGPGELLACLEEFVSGVVVRAPIILVLSVDGPRSLPPEPDDLSSVKRLAHALGARRLAEWWNVPAISQERIVEWLGVVEPRMVTELKGISLGRSGWISRIWDEWFHGGLVRREAIGMSWRFTKRWETPSERDILGTRLGLLIGPNKAEINLSAKALRYGAAEGLQFTPLAVAIAMDVDPAVLATLFQRLCISERNPEGILMPANQEVNNPSIEESQVTRLAFAGTRIWLTCLSGSDRHEIRAIKAEMAFALGGVYERRLNEYGRLIATLFTEAGIRDQGLTYQRAADFGLSRASLRFTANAIAAASAEPGIDPWTLAVDANHLVWSVHELAHSIPVDELLRMAASARDLAARAPNLYLETEALTLEGQLLTEVEEFQEAERTLALAVQQADKLESPSLRCKARLFAGRLASDQEDVVRAVALFTQAQAICRGVLGLERLDATASGYLANILVLKGGDVERAREHGREALKVWERLGATSSLPLSEAGTLLLLLGEIAYFFGPETDVGELLGRGLAILETVGDENNIARAFLLLGRMRFDRADWRGATEYLTRSLKTGLDLRLPYLQRQAMIGLSETAAAAGRFATGIRLRALAESIGSRPSLYEPQWVEERRPAVDDAKAFAQLELDRDGGWVLANSLRGDLT